MKKTWNFLMKNLPYKILAVVMAIALWLVVYNIDDPNKVNHILQRYPLQGQRPWKTWANAMWYWMEVIR